MSSWVKWLYSPPWASSQAFTFPDLVLLWKGGPGWFHRSTAVAPHVASSWRQK